MLPFRIATLFFLLLTLIQLPAAAQSNQKAKRSVSYNYLLYVPEAYHTSKAAYPLVIYLHGGSHRGNDLSKLKQYGPPHSIEQGQQFDCLIVSPQCPEGRTWSTENWFDSLYAKLRTTYRIDPKRIYLTGVSMGGYGSWQTAVERPNTFAAIAPLCGGCDDSTQICRIRNVPVWTQHGTADDVIPIDETARLVRRLNECGGKVQFTQLTDKGHDILYLYDEKSIYNWLLRQHR